MSSTDRVLKIGIDLDGTVFNSIKTFCDVYINRHWDEIKNGHMKYPIWQRIKEWNMGDEMPLLSLEELGDIFQCDEFFDNLQIYYEPNGVNMVDFLLELAWRHDVYLVSCGSKENLQKKKEWLRSKLPTCNFIGIEHKEGSYMNKSQFECDIFLDDNQDALYSVKSKYKLLANFHAEKVAQWNSMAVKDKTVYNCESLTDAINTIYDIIDFENNCVVRVDKR